MLKIDKHVIQNRRTRQKIIMNSPEKQTFLFSHHILNLATLFIEEKAKQSKETCNKVCNTEQNANSYADNKFL